MDKNNNAGGILCLSRIKILCRVVRRGRNFCGKICMGSIASVLQWHCSQCKHINPTEVSSCSECGTQRVLVATKSHLQEQDQRDPLITTGSTGLCQQSLQEPKKSRSEKQETCHAGGNHQSASFECHLEEPKIAEWYVKFCMEFIFDLKGCRKRGECRGFSL